jgi:hypothetical protein
VTAVAALRDLAAKRRAAGTEVWAVGLTLEEQRMFQRWGPGAGARSFATVEKALAAARVDR